VGVRSFIWANTPKKIACGACALKGARVTLDTWPPRPQRERKKMLYEIAIVLAPFVVMILALAMGADITDDRFKNND